MTGISFCSKIVFLFVFSGSIDTQDYNSSKFTQDPAHARDLAEAGALDPFDAREKWRDAGDASRRFI